MPKTSASSSKIAHFVILMMENRSFDHLFGFRPGVEGLKGNEFNLLDPTKPEGPLNPAISVGTGAPYAITVGQGPGHSVNQTSRQLFGTAGVTTAVNDGFVESYRIELTFADHVNNPSLADIGVCMQSFEAARLPALNQLADEFCVCDRWFSEVPGPTQPNRLYLHAATSGGHGLNAWSLHFDFKTIYEQIQAKGLTWATYEHDTNEVRWFTRIQKYKKNFKKIDSFAGDVKSGKLANYTFIVPRMLSGKTHQIVNSQHAPNDVRYGDILIADVYEALRANSKVWEQSALIILYDEHGGFYDHVAPPSTVNPDGLNSPRPADPHYAPDFKFDRLGLRVPAVIASPWIPKGTVYKKQLQHTSVMQTAREIFGIKGTLTKRDAAAASFADVFSLAAARTDAPVKLQRPTLAVEPPETSPLHPGNKGLDPIQRDIVMGVNHNTRVTQPDNPPAELLPRIQVKASEFVIEKIRVHFARLPARKAPPRARAAHHG